MAVLSDGRTRQAEREQLQAEGIASGNIREMQPRAVWYKPDGSRVWPEGKTGPSDSYHERRFRARGWTLAPPETIARNRQLRLELSQEE
jgi:hypothetical protein